jgi:hypothetical protein
MIKPRDPATSIRHSTYFGAALFWYVCLWLIWNLELVSGLMAIELVRFRILTLNVETVREFLLPQPSLNKKVL